MLGQHWYLVKMLLWLCFWFDLHYFTLIYFVSNLLLLSHTHTHTNTKKAKKKWKKKLWKEKKGKKIMTLSKNVPYLFRCSLATTTTTTTTLFSQFISLNPSLPYYRWTKTSKEKRNTNNMKHMKRKEKYKTKKKWKRKGKKTATLKMFFFCFPPHFFFPCLLPSIQLLSENNVLKF